MPRRKGCGGCDAKEPKGSSLGSVIKVRRTVHESFRVGSVSGLQCVLCPTLL